MLVEGRSQQYQQGNGSNIATIAAGISPSVPINNTLPHHVLLGRFPLPHPQLSQHHQHSHPHPQLPQHSQHPKHLQHLQHLQHNELRHLVPDSCEDLNFVESTMVSPAFSRPVNCVRRDGFVLKRFNSMYDAAVFFKRDGEAHAIHQCCLKNQETFMGFQWDFASDFADPSEENQMSIQDLLQHSISTEAKVKSKPVECMSLEDGTVLQRFLSVKEAASFVKKPNSFSSIAKCCSGNRFSFYGFGWRYRDVEGFSVTDEGISPAKSVEELIQRAEEIKPKHIACFRIDDGALLRVFSSVRDAALFLKRSSTFSCISYNCLGMSASAYGFRWKFVDTPTSEEEGQPLLSLDELLKYSDYEANKPVSDVGDDGVVFPEGVKKRKKRKRTEKCMKPVECLSIRDDRVLKRFRSIREACEFLNKSSCHGCISHCCHGKQDTAFGFKWRFVSSGDGDGDDSDEEDGDLDGAEGSGAVERAPLHRGEVPSGKASTAAGSPPTSSVDSPVETLEALMEHCVLPSRKVVELLSPTTGQVLCTFASVQAGASYICRGSSHGSISQACHGRNGGSALGFIWRFADAPSGVAMNPFDPHPMILLDELRAHLLPYTSKRVHSAVALAAPSHPNRDSDSENEGNGNDGSAGLEGGMALLSPNKAVLAAAAAAKGRKRTRTRDGDHKAVECLSIDNSVVLRRFPSVKDAATFLQKPKHHALIASCCDGRVEAALGFSWRFADESVRFLKPDTTPATFTTSHQMNGQRELGAGNHNVDLPIDTTNPISLGGVHEANVDVRDFMEGMDVEKGQDIPLDVMAAALNQPPSSLCDFQTHALLYDPAQTHASFHSQGHLQPDHQPPPLQPRLVGHDHNSSGTHQVVGVSAVTESREYSLDEMRALAKEWSSNKKKPVDCFRLGDDAFLMRFPSVKDAAKFLGKPSSCISDCCTGKMNTAHGFKWRFSNAGMVPRRRSSSMDKARQHSKGGDVAEAADATAADAKAAGNGQAPAEPLKPVGTILTLDDLLTHQDAYNNRRNGWSKRMSAGGAALRV